MLTGIFQKQFTKVDYFYKLSLEQLKFFDQYNNQERMKANVSQEGKRALIPTAHPKEGLQEIRSYLVALNIKNNSDLYSKLTDLENSGKQEWIMAAIRECLSVRRSHSYVFHLIYLFDYLLALPKFSIILQGYLVQFYCDLFKHLLCQQNYQALDEIKIIRKYWIRKVNYQIYANIQQIILQWFRVDIEIIPEFAVNDLKTFYIDMLNMSYNDVYFHIPQLKTFESHHKNQRTIYRLNKDKIQEFINRDEQSNNCVPSKNEDQNMTVTLRGRNHDNISQLNESTINDSHARQKALPSQQELLALRRARHDSQETTISIKCTKRMKLDTDECLNDSSDKSIDSLVSNYEQSHHVPQHFAQINRSRKARQTLFCKNKSVSKEYNFLLYHICQRCGMKFQLKEDLDIHCKQHTQKIGNNSIEGDNKEKTADEPKDFIQVKEQQCFQFSRTCKVCESQMEVKYKNGNWVFINCVKVNIYDVDTILHALCRSELALSADQPSADAPNEE